MTKEKLYNLLDILIANNVQYVRFHKNNEILFDLYSYKHINIQYSDRKELLNAIHIAFDGLQWCGGNFSETPFDLDTVHKMLKLWSFR